VGSVQLELSVWFQSLQLEHRLDEEFGELRIEYIMRAGYTTLGICSGEWKVNEDAVRELAPDGVAFFSDSARRLVVKVGNHRKIYMHIDEARKMQQLRHAIGECFIEIRRRERHDIYFPDQTLDEIIAHFDYTVFRISKQLREIFIENEDFIDKILVEYIEPQGIQKSFVYMEEPVFAEEGVQLDIVSAYAQAAEKLGDWTVEVQKSNDIVSVDVGRHTFEIGGLERKKSYKFEPGLRYFDWVWARLSSIKSFRLQFMGACLSNVGDGEGSGVKMAWLDKETNAYKVQIARFRRRRSDSFWQSCLLARAAIRELAMIAYVLCENVKVVLTDSFLCLDDSVTRVLDLFDFSYREQARGDVEAYAVSCFRVGEKKSKSFDKLSDMYRNSEYVLSPTPIPRMIPVRALPVVLGLSADVVASMIKYLHDDLTSAKISATIS
jgi:hypothetical protein